MADRERSGHRGLGAFRGGHAGPMHHVARGLDGLAEAEQPGEVRLERLGAPLVNSSGFHIPGSSVSTMRSSSTPEPFSVQWVSRGW